MGEGSCAETPVGGVGRLLHQARRVAGQGRAAGQGGMPARAEGPQGHGGVPARGLEGPQVWMLRAAGGWPACGGGQPAGWPGSAAGVSALAGAYCRGSGWLTAGMAGAGLSFTSCCAASRPASAAASCSLVLP
jgi:hypothetical protein